MVLLCSSDNTATKVFCCKSVSQWATEIIVSQLDFFTIFYSFFFTISQLSVNIILLNNSVVGGRLLLFWHYVRAVIIKLFVWWNNPERLPWATGLGRGELRIYLSLFMNTVVNKVVGRQNSIWLWYFWHQENTTWREQEREREEEGGRERIRLSGNPG